MSETVAERVAELLGQAGDVDDALRATVALLAAEPGVVWAGISFREEGELVLGPHAGEPDGTRRSATPIAYQGDAVGELVVDGEADPGTLARIAELLAPAVLLGWDTGGETWEP